MPRLTIVRGVSGSGKSTWAEAQAGNPVIVSRDRIRLGIFGSNDQDYYQVASEVMKAREDLVTDIQANTIASGLTRGHDVIVDNTNTDWKYVKQLAKIAWKSGAEVVIKTFDVPLDVAIKQNRARAMSGGRDVPENIIRRQHQQLQGTKHLTEANLQLPPIPEPYNGTPGKPMAIMFDLDGTLFHHHDRSPYDMSRVSEDTVDEVIAELIRTLESSKTYHLIAMSGRNECAREDSMDAMFGAGIIPDYLFMRADDDMRSDDIVKAELFDKHVRDNFDVRAVFDDRNQVVDMWRRMGIKCLQVAEGDF